MRHLRHLVLILAPALLTGCPLLELAVEVESACVTTDPIEVAGAPDDAAVAIEQTLDISEQAAELRDALGKIGASASVELVTVDLSVALGDAASPPGDMVEQVSLIVRAPGTELAPVEVFRCEACRIDGNLLTLEIAPVELFQYIEAGALELDVSLIARPPQDAWSVAVDMCFDSTAELVL